MTKTVNATCEAGVVKVGDFTITEVTILSEGVASSTGVLFIDQDKKYYIPNATSDLKLTLEKVIDSLTKIGLVFSSIGANMLGPLTAPPPTLASDLVELNNFVIELTMLKEELK